EPARTVLQDFSVRFYPDNPRLHRGGNVAIWCDVQRRNAFHGDVTITPEGLPPGVSAGPVTLSDNDSGWFTLSASADAALGTAPLHLRASATIGPAPVSHEANGAYLTVLDPAPFGVQAVASMTPQQIEQAASQIQALSAKLNAPDQAFDAAMAQWERKVSRLPVWTVLNPATIASEKGTVLARQPDGSVLATGAFPAQDRYTLTAHTDLKGITAVRLEVLADPRLPAHGPGTAPNGNFVLNEFSVSVSPEGKPAQPVKLASAFARYSQPNFPVAAAIDGNPSTGWAIDNRQGRDHTAIFQAQSPIKAGDGTMLTFVLNHQSAFAQHNIGRFRVSVTDADPAALQNEAQLPPDVLRIVSTPFEFRADHERARLRAYFRTIDPQTAAERSRLEAMRSFAAPYSEINRIQTVLKSPLPQLAAEQERWEKDLARGTGWSVLHVQSAHSTGGADLNVEPDGSIFVEGPSAATDSYELLAKTSIKGITAVRLEALPDPRLPGNGPGRGPNGNFVLTGIHVVADQDVPIASAVASAEQQGFPISGALDGKGWGIGPATGQPLDATFYLKQPTGSSGIIKISLDQHSKFPQHTIGHFRIWVTANPEPDAAARSPEGISEIVNIPPASRSPEQKGRLAAYFRAIAPSLKPLRARLADLQGSVPMMPFKFQRNRPAVLPVPITRTGGFKGDVTVTLEGFVRAADGAEPAPISREFKIQPLMFTGDKQFGMLSFEPDRVAETGTRKVVLKAESKVGDETLVTYSPAFPITIEK
ncbi:MAG TPA: hypothetical protein VN541_18350, partial [Tepidisphaeraceae bacterium]|nr:hypothetical protein [Tepidisphaeraceae bacterium]